MNWIEQVTILDLLVKGLIVGVVVSAPLGPVGVLCIQRTLNKGRWYGFVTGLGAALSDIGYACLLYTSPSPRDISGSRMPSSA